MGADELNKLLNQLQRKTSNALLMPPDEKIPAAPVDAGAERAQTSRAANTAQSQGDDDMTKWTSAQIDEHRSRNRMRERKPPGAQRRALTVIDAATQVVASPAAPSVTAPSVTLVPPTPSRLDRLWHWLFAAPPQSTTVDLVQLRRDIKEWTKLQLKINRHPNAERNFRIRSEIGRWICLLLTLGALALVVCAALNI